MEEARQAESTKLYDYLDKAYRNRKEIGIGVAIVAAVAIAAAIYSWRQGENEIAANHALLTVPGAYSGPATALAVPDGFLKVAGDFPGTAAGARAELLAANILFKQGKYAEAQAAYAKVAAIDSQPALQAQAEYGVAACLDSTGKASEAAAKYQDVITRFPNDTVSSLAKLGQARIHEAQGKNDLALRLYEELGRAGQYDPWAAEAGERRQELVSKHPELLKTLPSVSAPGMIPSLTPSVAPTSAPPAK
jgi:TolA-binding protein